jgi:cytochrome c oxidase cbb3-type subunit 3
MKSDDREMQGHEYDGIKEFDNPLPNWWLMTFLGTIIFAFLYFIHYEVGGGPSLNQELQAAMKSFESKKSSGTKSLTAKAAEFTELQLADLAQDPKNLALGAQIYEGKCAMCHGPQLQGIVGPNLTDKFWKHGKGTRLDIAHVVRVGVPDKGMAAWALLLKDEEIYAVTNYIFTKKGSGPPNPKAAEGDLVE